MIVDGKTYFTNIEEKLQCSYIDSNGHLDIVIIGGGITGLIISYYLNKNNFNTTIIEKNRIGYGSTSITTALLQYELDDNINKLKQYFTEEQLKEIYLSCSNALLDIKEICNVIKCSYITNDCLLYSNKDIDKVELYEEYLFRKNINLDVDFINYDEEIKNGIISNNGGVSFNPYEFSIKLAKYLLNRNVKIYENSLVKNIDYNNKIISTLYNEITYNKLIIATGYDINLFTNKQLGTMAYTYNIVTKEVDVDNTFLIRDNKDPYNYYRVHNKRIIAGGYDTVSYNKKELDNIYNNLLNNIKRVYNINTTVDYKYCGVFKSTKDNLGYFGKLCNNNVYYALGYGANGIVYAILGANIITDDLLNKKNNLSKYFDLNR